MNPAQIDLLRSIKAIQDLIKAMDPEKPDPALFKILSGYVDDAERFAKELFSM